MDIETLCVERAHIERQVQSNSSSVDDEQKHVILLR
jgi:hypothetical protein